MDIKDEKFVRTHARLTKEFLKENEDFMIEDGRKMKLVCHKKRIEKVQSIYHEELGDDLMQFIEFEPRKMLSSEKKLVAVSISIILFTIYLFTILALAAFTGISDQNLEKMNYIANTVGVLLGSWVIWQSFKYKSKTQFFLGVIALITNGAFVIDYWYSIY